MKTWTRESEIQLEATDTAVVDPTYRTQAAPSRGRLKVVRDPVLVILALAATVLGLVFVFDAGYARSIRDDKGAIPPEFISQIIFLGPALFAGWVCARLRPNFWEKAAKPLWVLTVIALAAVLIPGIGYEMGGASRWFKVGRFTIQPAEFAKVAVILYLAAAFAHRKAWPKKVKVPKSLALRIDTIWIPKLIRAMPAVWVGLALLLTELEPDLGTGFIIAAVAFALMWAGGVSKRSLAWSVGLAALAVLVMIQVQPYRLERFTAHGTRWEAGNLDGIAYQTVQSELAMASGGSFGVGMGAGRAKHVMPAATTDFISATIAEEFGLVGWLAVVAVLGGLTYRLAVQATRAPTRFGQLVLIGFAAWIGVQSILNLTMANGLLPAIGIPLPFISSGGSSLLALWIAVGMSQAALAPAMVKQEDAVAADRHGWRNRRTRLSRA